MHSAALSTDVLGGMLENGPQRAQGVRVELGGFVLMPAVSGVLQGVS